MDKPNVSALAQKMIDAVRGFVARAESAINLRIDELEKRIAAIPAGPKGDKGEPGESIRGEKGVPGERGETGAQGSAGEVGARGEPGRQGEPGEAGLQGGRGEPGPKGEPGDRGTDGLQGRAGEPGAPGAPGTIGEKGTPGARGPDGRDGRDGKDGAPGRDAADLNVLSGIDESRSYPAGTWARYGGGWLRAERQTDPVTDGVVNAGWVVMIEGVSAIVVLQGEDPRELSVVTMLTGGTKAVTSFHIPMVLDRGVWRDGEYEKGDYVSWDGSGWIAQRKTSAKPGSSPEDWRLSTKRGRDGKDANPDTPPAARQPVRLK